MSNITKQPVWKLDTVGIISDKPVRIKFLQLYPNAAGDAFELDFWDELAPVTASKLVVTAATSSTSFTQSGGTDFSSTNFPQYDVLKIIGSNGAVGNLGYHWIAATGGTGNTVITVDSAFDTNESSKSYSVIAYGVKVAFAGISQATTKVDDYYFFGDNGLYLPNLILKSISSSAVIYAGIVTA